MINTKVYVALFALMLSLSHARAQSPEDIAAEIFENLVAKDRKNLSYYELDHHKSDEVFYHYHLVDTSKFEGYYYDLVETDFSGTAVELFMREDFDMNAHIKRISIDSTPEFMLIGKYNSIQIRQEALKNEEFPVVSANVYFDHDGNEFILQLPLAMYEGYYYLLYWYDLFPRLSRSFTLNETIPVNKVMEVKISRYKDVLWNIAGNQLIETNEFTYMSDAAYFEAGFGIKVEDLYFVSLLTYTGEKGRFCDYWIDKDFEQIKYKDVKDLTCDIRYHAEAGELLIFIFKDPQGRFYKIMIDEKTVYNEELIMYYARLN